MWPISIRAVHYKIIILSFLIYFSPVVLYVYFLMHNFIITKIYKKKSSLQQIADPGGTTMNKERRNQQKNPTKLW